MFNSEEKKTVITGIEPDPRSLAAIATADAIPKAAIAHGLGCKNCEHASGPINPDSPPADPPFVDCGNHLQGFYCTAYKAAK